VTPRHPGAALRRALPALTLALLALVAARALSDRDAGPAVAVLGLYAAAVLALVAFGATRRLERTLAGCALLVGIVVVWLPHGSPLAWATISALLVAALAFAAAERLGDARPPGVLPLLALVAATALLVRAPRIVTGDVAFAPAAKWVVTATFAAVAFAALGRVAPRAVLPVALAAVAAAPGFGGLVAAALAAVALVAGLGGARALAVAAPPLLAAAALPREPLWVPALLALALAAALARPAWAMRSGRAGLAALALASLLAASGPWVRRAPLATTLAALARAPLGSSTHRPTGDAGRLTALRPRFEVPLAGDRVRALRVDSALGHGAQLPCGVRVARIALLREGEELFAADLHVGADSADWAAARPDVAAALACAPPAPHAVWIVPGRGFLAARHRARVPLPQGLAGDQLLVERAPELAPEVEVLLFEVGVDR
jgi:hypothetical protein